MWKGKTLGISAVQDSAQLSSVYCCVLHFLWNFSLPQLNDKSSWKRTEIQTKEIKPKKSTTKIGLRTNQEKCRKSTWLVGSKPRAYKIVFAKIKLAKWPAFCSRRRSRSQRWNRSGNLSGAGAGAENLKNGRLREPCLKGVSRDFRPPFFHDSNQSEPLINSLKYFRIRFRCNIRLRSSKNSTPRCAWHRRVKILGLANHFFTSFLSW